MHKKLYLHAGGSKTGSSAIQAFLKKHASSLERHGFAYKNTLGVQSGVEITSGNGQLLYNCLNASGAIQGVDVNLEGVVLSYFADKNNAIVSSEELQHLTVPQINRLVLVTSSLGIELHVIFYVRNIVPFFLSVYDQMIKRHGEFKPIDKWVLDLKSSEHIEFLRNIAEAILPSNIHVIHYETARTHIITAMLNILGIHEAFITDKELSNEIVNRSLTQNERELLIAANKILGATYSQELSDLFIYQSPNLMSEPASLTNDSIDFLISHFQKDIIWVNENFFNGDMILEANQPNIKSNTKRSIHKKLTNDITRIMLDWSLKKILDTRKEAECFIINRLILASQSHQANNNRDVPADFNPVDYLILNVDVLLTDIDPVQHWIKYGAIEDRDYKICNK